MSLEKANRHLEGLNEEQTLAATSIDGAVRLIAGAGSGKTFTLTRRVAYICDLKEIDPSRVLSLTFTNKAAGEMRSRTAKLMNLPDDAFNMSTFHSLALEIVKEHCEEVFGWKSFKIGNMSPSMLVPQFFKRNQHLFEDLSDAEVEVVQKYLLNKVNKVLKNNKYVGWLDNNADDIHLTKADVPDLLTYMYGDEERLSEYNRCKNGVKRVDKPEKIEAYLKDFQATQIPYNPNNPVSPWIKAIVKQKSGICTFDDIIHCALYLLENYPEIRDYWSNKFDYIQVDEFQDTDMQQLKIVQLLYERHGNLFVVGDPDQSIYLFRGAEPSLFNNLDNYIPNLKTIFMITNYRSSDEIVNISNKVIEMNKNRIKKTCVSKAGPNLKTELIFGDATASLGEKEFYEIQKLISDGVSANDIAVLYRSSNDKSTVELQNLLKQADIPFVTTLVSKNIYYDVVRNLCRYQYCGDETFLVNAAQYFEGNTNYGADTLVDLSKFENVDLVPNKLFSFFNDLKAKYTKKGEPTADYARFLASADNTKKAISDALNEWEALSDDDKKSECHVDLLLSDAEPLEGNGVKIMTMHKSKGLEFPYVFVNSLSRSGMDKAQDNAEVCEEKARLAYVAYSRAKIKLYLGCDSVNDMHGVLAQVCDMDEVETPNAQLKDQLNNQKPISISQYEDNLDAKTATVYYKLMFNGELKGYRCAYSLHGEKFGFHAKIDDLKRLDCVPNPKPFLVKLGRDIQVVKFENNHCYTFEEMNRSMRVVDLVKDDDIKAVFLGSNNGYNKDIKDVLELDNILIADANKKVVKPNKKIVNPVNKDVGSKKIDEPTKDISSKVQEKDSNISYVMLLSKNKKEPIGVRMIKGDKFKDISIEEAKDKGIQPKDCKEKKYIPIMCDMDYTTFIELNKRMKETSNDAEKVRLTDIDLAENKCKVVSSERNYEKVLYIDDFIKNFKKGCFRVSNPSALTSWRYWKNK